MKSLVLLNREFWCGFIENPNNIAILLSDLVLLLVASALLGLFAIFINKSTYVKSLSKLRDIKIKPTTNGISMSIVFTFLVGFITFIYGWFNLSAFEHILIQIVVFIGVFGLLTNLVFKIIQKTPRLNWPMRKVILFFKENRQPFSLDFIGLSLIAFFTVVLRGFPFIYQISVLRFLVLGRVDVVLWFDLVLVLFTVLVISPPVQNYFRTKYGNNVFRLLGYNTGAAKAAASSGQSSLAAKAALAAAGALVIDEGTANIRNHHGHIRECHLVREAWDEQNKACEGEPDLVKQAIEIPNRQEFIKRRLRHEAITIVDDVLGAAKKAALEINEEKTKTNEDLKWDPFGKCTDDGTSSDKGGSSKKK